MTTSINVQSLLDRRIEWARGKPLILEQDEPALRLQKGDRVALTGWTPREVEIAGVSADMPRSERVIALTTYWSEVWSEQEVKRRAELRRLQAEYEARAREKREVEALQKQRRVWQECGIGRGQVSIDFDSLAVSSDEYRKALDTCQAFPFCGIDGNAKSALNLIILGKKGTGKTTLAIATLRQMWFVDELQPAFISVADFILGLRATWGQSGGGKATKEFYDRYASAEVLVLDDIGAHYRTNGVATDLFPLFDRRWRDGLPTIVTSNLDWPALKELIGERSADRLNDKCVALELGGESFRKRLKVSP